MLFKHSVYPLLCICMCCEDILPLGFNGISCSPSFFSVSCSVSFHLIVSQKVTFYLQPHNIIIWTWHRSLVCTFNSCMYRPCVFFDVCGCVRATGRIKLREPRWPPIPIEPNVNFLSAFSRHDSKKALKDWHRELELVFLGSSCHDNVPDPQKIPTGSPIQSAPPSFPAPSLGGCTLTWHYR